MQPRLRSLDFNLGRSYHISQKSERTQHLDLAGLFSILRQILWNLKEKFVRKLKRTSYIHIFEELVAFIKSIKKFIFPVFGVPL